MGHSDPRHATRQQAMRQDAAGAHVAGAQANDLKSGRPLTIVLVCDSLGNEGNGTSNSALQFAEGLTRLGHHVRFVGLGSDEFPARPAHIPIVSRVAALQQMAFARPDERLFRRAFAGADVVHCYLPVSFERRALDVAHSMGIAVTAGFHLQPENMLYSAGPLRYLPGGPSLIYRMERAELYSHLLHVHAPSAMIASQLRRHGYANELHVFSNGYDPRFRPIEGISRDGGGWSDDPDGRRLRIVASGRLANEKDQITLIRAVSRCRHRDRIDLRICGKGPLREHLRREARRLHVRSAIGFTPHEELPGVLVRADLFVHPSIVDIESVSALEAIAAGLVPIVARSPLSAASQFALDDRSLFEAGDAAGLARKIDWWADHPQIRATMSPRYARFARQEFSLETSVRRFEAMERQAIADFRAMGR